ncbi:MAG: ABC transporter permease [Dehalococcoidia bacterium]
MQRTETSLPVQGKIRALESERRAPAASRGLKLARKYPLIAFFLSLLLLLLLVAIFADVLAPYSQFKTHPAQALQSPGAKHWLGTDQLGRDTLSRVIFGIRVSLIVAVIAVGIGTVGGITMGLIAGYSGGVIDQILSRFIDAQLAFPTLLLAISIVSALGASLTNAMIAVGITAIPSYMRLTRGQVLQAREYEYVTAARIIGASRSRIVVRHILPNILNPLIIVGSLGAGGAILTEAALSFIGIGAQPPTPDLGSMINNAKDYLQNQAWLAVGPGIAIFLIVWSFANLGDALRDALDPRLKER